MRGTGTWLIMDSRAPAFLAALLLLWLCSRICGRAWREMGKDCVSELGALPPKPLDLPLSGQNGGFGLDYNGGTRAEDRALQE